jgi:hypothetical protein
MTNPAPISFASCGKALEGPRTTATGAVANHVSTKTPFVFILPLVHGVELSLKP